MTGDGREHGLVDPRLAEEFPELRVLSVVVPAPGGRADPGVQERLRLLADRFTGAQAVELRRAPVPAAYRVFFRHVGIDPDVTRTPIEQAVVDRLVTGGHLRSRGRLGDALLLALLETSVPVSAVDEDRIAGAPGLRPARAGECLGGEEGPPVPAGRIVLADRERPIGELLGDVADAVRPGRRTRRLRLIAVRIPGVPAIHVEEALWTCQEALGAPAAG